MDSNGYVRFKAKPLKLVHESPNFKVVACHVDKEKFPFVEINNYGNASIIGDLPVLTGVYEYNIVATESKSKYGTSYRVKSIWRDSDRQYDASNTMGYIKGVLTESYANEVLRECPDIMSYVMDGREDEIDTSNMYGIGPKVIVQIANQLRNNIDVLDIVNMFNGSITIKLASKLKDAYVSADVLKRHMVEEPYKVLTSISGVGFKTADDFILKLCNTNSFSWGYDIRTSLDRCRAYIVYLLEQNEMEGNTRISIDGLKRRCVGGIGECAKWFDTAIQNDGVALCDGYAATNKTYNCELITSKKIMQALHDGCEHWNVDIEKYRRFNDVALTDEQAMAISNVCKNPVSIINGPGGCGKSSSLMAVVNMCDDLDKSVCFLAPTGKATRVIEGFTGCEASTIHRVVGALIREEYDEDGKLRIVPIPFDEDVVVVDEFSMVDVALFKQLLEHVDFKKTRLVFVGDDAQLPSVSCGNVLHDMLASKVIPSTTLTKVFRYSDGGLMKVATDTRLCKPYITSDMCGKVTTFGNNKDYVLLEMNQSMFEKNVKMIYGNLLEQGKKPKDIQVLTAKNKGEFGCEKYNKVIQNIVIGKFGLPEGITIKKNVGGDTVEDKYYIGDLVMQTKNNYRARLSKKDVKYGSDENNGTALVANGNVGTILDVWIDNQTHKKLVTIDFDGVIVDYDYENMRLVQLGYAMTTHKSQGSSIENVILISPKSDTFMLNSNLLYVGLTRTKRRCYHLANAKTVNLAVKKKADLSRDTFMQEMLEEF